MNFGIKINGEFLDLAPNTMLELEEENPFLQLTNEVQGQYSLPLSIPVTEKNMRLLNYPNLLNIKKSTAGIEAVCIANGVQHSRGQIKLESGQGNLNDGNRGSISIYYLFGVSDFYKSIEKVYLNEVNLGADIVVPKGNFDADGDGTFWDFIMNVMENGTHQQYNYAIFPAVNEAGLNYYPSTNVILNCISHYATTQKIRASRFTYDVESTGDRYSNEISPFVYLAYAIKQAFAHVGWAVQGSILNDADFLSIVILYNQPIDYLSAYAHNTNVTWNLKNHVPRIKLGKFLIGLANRFGWWYDFDYRKKVCTIQSRKGVFTTRTRKEFTTKTGANYSYKVNASDKIYSLVQSGGNGEIPDFKQLTFKGVIINSLQLPAANADAYYHLYFTQGENAYYFCTQDEEGNYSWQKSTDNNCDYVPDNHTDDITTCCLVPGTAVTPIFEIFPTQPYDPGNFDNTDRDICLPTFSILPDEQEAEIFYICYQHGMQPSMNNNSLPEMLYPAGGAGCHNLDAGLIHQTALVYEYKGQDGVERGLYATWWELFLNFMKQREEVTLPVQMTLADVLNIRYTDTILIRNAEFFIKNPHFTLPLNDFANMELVRI